MFLTLVSAKFSLDLSIRAAMLLGSNNSFFSNSETCFALLSSIFGFCFSFSTFWIFSISWSGNGIASGFSFLTFFGGACSETSFSFSFLTFSIIFSAFGAKGIFVWSVIWINSTDTKGGISIGFYATKGIVRTANNTTDKWNINDKIKFWGIDYLSLYGSDINATFVNPEPDSIPIISSTLP